MFVHCVLSHCPILYSCYSLPQQPCFLLCCIPDNSTYVSLYRTVTLLYFVFILLVLPFWLDFTIVAIVMLVVSRATCIYYCCCSHGNRHTCVVSVRSILYIDVIIIIRMICVALLRELDTLGWLGPFFTRETAFMTSCLISWPPNPLWKRFTLKGKTLLPVGAKSFLL